MWLPAIEALDCSPRWARSRARRRVVEVSEEIAGSICQKENETEVEAGGMRRRLARRWIYAITSPLSSRTHYFRTLRMDNGR